MSGTSVELVKIRLKKGTRKTCSDSAQDRFWEYLPTTFEAYNQATIANRDQIHTADSQGPVEEDTDHCDAMFV